jgi:hypothetical protein
MPAPGSCWPVPDQSREGQSTSTCRKAAGQSTHCRQAVSPLPRPSASVLCCCPRAAAACAAPMDCVSWMQMDAAALRGGRGQERRSRTRPAPSWLCHPPRWPSCHRLHTEGSIYTQSSVQQLANSTAIPGTGQAAGRKRSNLLSGNEGKQADLRTSTSASWRAPSSTETLFTRLRIACCCCCASAAELWCGVDGQAG